MTRTMACRNARTWSSRTFSANTTSAGVEAVAQGSGRLVLDEAVELERDGNVVEEQVDDRQERPVADRRLWRRREAHQPDRLTQPRLPR